MTRRLLSLLWLAWSGSALFTQSLSFPEGLTPFRINRAEVDQADSVALRLWGESYDGRKVSLFSGPGIPSRDGFLCYVYIDDDIRFLKGESKTSSGNTVHFSADLGRPRFHIAVYGFPGRLDGRSPWREVRNAEELRPGDVYVLPPEGDPVPILAAGIHVLTPGTHPMEGPDIRNPWRGYLLSAADLDASILTAVLESHREEFIAFKQRYRELPVSLSFQGPRIQRQNPLIFPPSTPVGIALTLQAETFRDRVGPLHRCALLGFSFAAIVAVAAVRRWEILLPLMGIFLTAFVIFSLVIPVMLRSLTVELALPPSQEDSNDRSIHLDPTADSSESTVRYRQRGIPTGSWRLVYRSLLAPGGEAPLRLFADDELVRFNQVPEVHQHDGRLLLKFRNPLSAWSLHEPE